MEAIPALDTKPVVVLGEHILAQSDEAVTDLLHTFESLDDVYSKGFADSGLVFYGANSSVTKKSPSTPTGLWNSSSIYHLNPGSLTKELPPGPYFLQGQNLHQAWRLYPDYLDAFIFGVIPEDVHNHQRFIQISIEGLHTN